MAYGQTGSGKTHTMLGSHKNEDYNPSRDPHRDEGVIPRAARELFRSVLDSGKTGRYLYVTTISFINLFYFLNDQNNVKNT